MSPCLSAAAHLLLACNGMIRNVAGLTRLAGGFCKGQKSHSVQTMKTSLPQQIGCSTARGAPGKTLHHSILFWVFPSAAAVAITSVGAA